MPVRPLNRDLAGNLILPGKVTKKIEAPFGIDGTTSLPTWLSASGTGTVSVSNQSAGLGEVVITSPSGGSETLQTTQLLNLGSFEAVLWETEGIYTPDTNLDNWTIGLQATNFGFYCVFSATAFSGAGDAYTKLKPSGTNQVSFPFGYDVTNWWQNRHNLGVLLLPRYGHIYVMMGDQVMADIDYSGGTGSSGTLLNGAVNATVSCTAKAAVVTVAHVQQLRLTTVSY